MRESFWAVVLTNFKHRFDLKIIIIIIQLYNTNGTMHVAESRETLWIALTTNVYKAHVYAN